jgi:hypothetical protein
MTVEVEIVHVRAVSVRVIVFVEYTVTSVGVVVVSSTLVWQGIVVVLAGRFVESVSVIVDVIVVAFGVEVYPKTSVGVAVIVTGTPTVR